MVASWACDVTVILTQRSTEGGLFCVRITVTSQAQLATKYHMAVLVVYDTI